MPRKGAICQERLRAAAEKAASSSPIPNVTCRHIPRGPEYVSNRSQVSFEWHVQSQGFEDVQRVTLKCGNALSRGIPFPATWRAATHFLHVNEVAKRSADEESRARGLPSLRCAVLGRAKSFPLPSTSAAASTGSAVTS